MTKKEKGQIELVGDRIDCVSDNIANLTVEVVDVGESVAVCRSSLGDLALSTQSALDSLKMSLNTCKQALRILTPCAFALGILVGVFI